MTTTITPSTPALVSWLEKITAQSVEYYSARFANLSPTTFTVEDGQKFIRVVAHSGGSRSVHVFIAKVDSETKTLGKVRAGDILKPASWKTPAKHARGNILDADGGMSQMTPYGAQHR
jgi:hypothetical protein